MRASKSQIVVKWGPEEARSLNGAKTRVRILRVAAELFHKQGVRLTTPAEIIKAAGTGKGQFYHYFKNKNFLVHEVLQCFLAAVAAGTAPVSYDISSWQDVKRFFLSHIDFQRKFGMTRSCPIGTVANEVSEEDELVRKDINLIVEMMESKLAAFFAKEKARGLLIKGVSPEVAADFCIATIQGAMLLGKTNRSSRPAEAAVKEALLHLQNYVQATRGNLKAKGTLAIL